MKNKAQQGFTLIELVVVIVILGILAVTAAPKFINLQADARTATLEAVKASMQSAYTLVHSKSLIQGNESAVAADGETVVVNSQGDVVNLDLGYPISTAGAATVPADDWALLLEVNADEFIISDDSIAGYVVVYPEGGTEPTALPADNDAPTAAESSCFAYYQESQALGTSPVTDVVICL
ncbi:type II secretion system protein [Colwellia sp. RSH04]|nr:type II secretion system protein [Colwellia sp. RSH04]